MFNNYLVKDFRMEAPKRQYGGGGVMNYKRRLFSVTQIVQYRLFLLS